MKNDPTKPTLNLNETRILARSIFDSQSSIFAQSITEYVQVLKNELDQSRNEVAQLKNLVNGITKVLERQGIACSLSDVSTIVVPEGIS